jgi:hypothetical protein
MTRLPVDKVLAHLLEKTIASFKKDKILGEPDPNPRITEADLDTRKDVPWNRHMYVYHCPYENIDDIQEAAKGLISGNVKLTGRFYYPPGGFMGWHTNSNDLGFRIYATFCKEGGKSFFRYLDGVIRTEYEEAGWNFRLFEIRRDKLYWHCVYSDTDRFSFGFNFYV